MYNNKRVLAFIPARSGSKGLKDKNIKLLNGKPLLAYSIEAAKISKIFDEIHVSTDSKIYAEIALAYGANVPFLRDKRLAEDFTSMWDSVKWTLTKYHELGKTFDLFMILQPTSPLRRVEDIINVYDIIIHQNVNTVVSVCETEVSPLVCNKLPSDKSLVGFLDKNISDLPRQQLDKYYKFNGAIFAVKTEYFNDVVIENIYNCKSFAYVMPKQYSIDIDDKYDFIFAEAIISACL